MSVWTKVQSKVLYENVDIEILQEALSTINVTLDFNTKEIENAYGKSVVDAGLKNKGETTSLGIVIGRNKGITLVGDTWRSGIVGDKQANKLIDMMSQLYQKTKVKKELENQGWLVKEIKKDDKITLECMQY